MCEQIAHENVLYRHRGSPDSARHHDGKPSLIEPIGVDIADLPDRETDGQIENGSSVFNGVPSPYSRPVCLDVGRRASDATAGRKATCQQALEFLVVKLVGGSSGHSRHVAVPRRTEVIGRDRRGPIRYRKRWSGDAT